MSFPSPFTLSFLRLFASFFHPSAVGLVFLFLRSFDGGRAAHLRPVLGVAVVVPPGDVMIERRHVNILPLFAGGGPGMGFLQVGLHDVGVDLGRGDVGMAEKLLDMPDRGSALQHLGSAGMPQAVRGDVVGEMGLVPVGFDDAAQVVGPERQPGCREEDNGRGVLPQEDGPHGFEIFAQVAGRHLPHRDNTLFPAFAEDPDHACL